MCQEAPGTPADAARAIFPSYLQAAVSTQSAVLAFLPTMFVLGSRLYLTKHGI